MMTTADVYRWLEEVKDPEIPVLSLVDLGVISAVSVQDRNVTIQLTPTFIGCPALDMMKQEITEVMRAHGAAEVAVEVTFSKPWTSDMISAKGRAALQKFGLAPPPSATLFTDLDVLEHATCPRCNGTDTELKSAFGPTLCRSIHYCNTCHEAFEQFKPI